MGHNAAINCIIYTSNTLISGGDDSVIKIWNYENGECLKKLEGHKGKIYCISLIENTE